MKVAILKKVNTNYVLHLDGVVAVCPFKNSCPAQTNLGKIEIITQPCESSCPHFKMYKHKDFPGGVSIDPKENETGKIQIELTCATYTAIVCEVEAPADKPTLKLH